MNPSTASPSVQIENLTCRYLTREGAALRDLSLSIYPGQILLVSGASGCGKTTLLRCVNGLIPRSYRAEVTGKILLNGEDFAEKPLSAISQAVGTVLQDPERQVVGAFVQNEVAFGLENLGLPREEIIQRVDETLDYLGMLSLKHRETFSLSGGEKQKVALAGVLAMRPGILALDEPLANLDPASAQDALTLIRRLADEGKTILLIEHRVEDVLWIKPDLALHMHDGSASYLGPVDGLLEAADYHAVKLPAAVVIRRAAQNSPRPAAPVHPARADAPALIEFDDITFGYVEDQPILKNVSLTVRQGDVIALLGPNGAGKTTLVKHAIGLLRPQTGSVCLRGKDTHDLTIAEMAGTVGYVFQSPRHMLFAPTVREELAFGPKNLKHAPADIDEDSRQALAVVHLGDEIDRPPLALSFGQQKRITIASILAMRSAILVMDEPTAGQDFANYMSFMDSVAGLGTDIEKPYSFSAILFITHDVDLAAVYANRVLLIGDGGIVADGSPPEVMKDFDLLRRYRVVPTTLLEENLKRIDRTGRFMRAEALAVAMK